MDSKRLKIHNNFQPNKCGKMSFVGEADDWISELPDEILVHILSLLSLKEAARTSVLSSRWINLWKHTPSLCFDAQQSLIDKLYLDVELLESERLKYVKWVNSVIQSHISPALKEFKIRFNLNKSSSKAITQWLEFAFSRKVERLELDIKTRHGSSKYYCFPDEFLTLTNFRPPPNFQPASHSMLVAAGFKSLKALVFKFVRVSGGAIEFLLHNCPLLEQLIVHESNKLSKLQVCGSSLKLKHLEIVHCCPGLESLKVSAPKLTTLIVTTVTGLLLENVPMLVNVSVRCDPDSISIKRLFDVVLSRCISHMHTLYLGQYSCGFLRGEMDEICDLPKMPNLKKLVIEYCGRGHESLIRLAALIRASPYLEEFVLQFNWSTLPREDRQIEGAVANSPHHHLKIFKFCSYYGSANDVELLSYILENCIVLEKIIIDPDFVWFRDKLEVEETARLNVKQKLAPQVPRHIELVVL
ncbi:hypothetical protein ABFS82_08G119900 [Erythranthe guttata]